MNYKNEPFGGWLWAGGHFYHPDKGLRYILNEDEIRLYLYLVCHQLDYPEAFVSYITNKLDKAHLF